MLSGEKDEEEKINQNYHQSKNDNYFVFISDIDTQKPVWVLIIELTNYRLHIVKNQRMLIVPCYSTCFQVFQNCLRDHFLISIPKLQYRLPLTLSIQWNSHGSVQKARLSSAMVILKYGSCWITSPPT